METLMKELCRVHGLTTVSVTFHASQGFATVFLHWDVGRCARGEGSTFDAAFKAALASMEARRLDDVAFGKMRAA